MHYRVSDGCAGRKEALETRCRQRRERDRQTIGRASTETAGNLAEAGAAAQPSGGVGAQVVEGSNDNVVEGVNGEGNPATMRRGRQYMVWSSEQSVGRGMSKVDCSGKTEWME